jgi:hypothetical protein
MTVATIIGLSIAITIAAFLIRFAIWIAWPRKIEFDNDPLSEPHGDVPFDQRRRG